MRIIILHTLAFERVNYDKYIDHNSHEVTYVGTSEAVLNIPHNVKHHRYIIKNENDKFPETKLFMEKNNPFDLVIAICEIDLISAAQLREYFNIPGFTPDKVALYIDKIKMKNAISKAGLRAPQYMSCADLNNMPWLGKTVLKPIDGTSSQNVQIFPSLQDAVAYVKNEINKNNDFNLQKYEFEEYIKGPHFHFDGVMHEGEPYKVIMSCYADTCLNYFKNGAPFASIQLPDDKEAIEWAIACVKAVDIKNGTFHLEAIKSKDGFVFMEIAARAAGAGIAEAFHKATAINLFEHTLYADIKNAKDDFPFNEKITWELPASVSLYYGVFMFPAHHLSSEYCEIQGADVFEHHPNIERLSLLPKGKKISKKPTCLHSELPMSGIMKGSSSEELVMFTKKLFETIKIYPV